MPFRAAASWMETKMQALKMAGVVALSAACMGGSAGPSAAQSICGARNDVIKALNQQIDESPVGLGLTGSQQAVELLVSKAGTWTLLVTMPDGMSCILSAGRNWEGMTIPVKGVKA